MGSDLLYQLYTAGYGAVIRLTPTAEAWKGDRTLYCSRPTSPVVIINSQQKVQPLADVVPSPGALSFSIILPSRNGAAISTLVQGRLVAGHLMPRLTGGVPLLRGGSTGFEERGAQAMSKA